MTDTKGVPNAPYRDSGGRPSYATQRTVLGAHAADTTPTT
jgi:hypothetical protein